MSKVIVTRIIRSSETFGGQVPPHNPTPRCKCCGAVLKADSRPAYRRARTALAQARAGKHRNPS